MNKKMTTEEVFGKDWKYFSQRQRMSPFPNYMSMESMQKESVEFIGLGTDSIMMIFGSGIFTAYIVNKEETGKKLLEQLMKKSGLFRALIKKQHGFGKKLVKFSKSSYERDLSIVDNNSLFKIYAEFVRLYKSVYATYGAVWIIESTLHDELHRIVQTRIKDEDIVKDHINILTLQPKAMVAKIEKEHLMEIALKSQQKGWGDLVRKGLFEEFPKPLKKLVEKHERDFFWVTRDYEDPVIDKNNIIERLKIMMDLDLAAELKKIKEENEALPKNKSKIFKELSLKRDEKKLFDAMLDVAFLKELRKKYVSMSLYYFDKVLSEIGRRGYLSIKQVRLLSESDVEELLLKGKDLSEECNQRNRLSVWVMDKGETTIFTGDDASLIKSKLMSSDKSSEFIGEPVSPGKATGPVRIILNPDEVNKVKDGDIIVSIQVVPSFSSAMQRAAGLICDGGHGITTHPAIMAREARIPAIIKAKNACTSLKDGDIVEVDGYKGTARKIS